MASNNTSHNNNDQETQQEREDRLTAAQALVELSFAFIDHTRSQIVPPAISTSSFPSRAFNNQQSQMPEPQYSERSRNGLTLHQTTGTSTSAINDPHLAYLHPSTSAFARSSDSQIRPQPRSASLSPSDPSINTIDFEIQSPTAESNVRSQTEDIEAQSAAQILMNIHSANRSPTQSRFDVNLLDVGGSGRSGLRSRGVTIRRQGAMPVDERLSTEETVAEDAVGEKSESSLTSLEELEVGKGEDNVEEEQEFRAASRKVQPGGSQKGKGKAKKPEKATKKKKEKKTSSGVAKDYQRHSVRDGKGRFIKK